MIHIAGIVLSAVFLLTTYHHPSAPLAHETTSQETTWQEAYAALLYHYEAEIAHTHEELYWAFTLFDTNGNGTPELIIWESAPGRRRLGHCRQRHDKFASHPGV